VKNNSEAHILEDILQDIRNFAGAAEQFDDITMLGLSFLDIRK
jgi:serine phosphatase RsbU (regulator of sigma subunit)